MYVSVYVARIVTQKHSRMEREKKMTRTEAARISKMVSLSRGLYGRVARAMGCDVSYVSRVARGERRSAKIEAALCKEFKNALHKLNLHLGQRRKVAYFFSTDVVSKKSGSARTGASNPAITGLL
jgi:transcriptional regulator with XRE-family HTH domain